MTNVMELPLGSVKDLPSTAGVYWVLAGESVLYVGQSTNLWQRWVSHHRIVDLRQLAADLIRWMPVARDQLLTVELELIGQLRPVLNGRRGSGPITISGLVKKTIVIHADQLARLERICRERHVNKSVVIREALDEKLDRMERGAPLIESAYRRPATA